MLEDAISETKFHTNRFIDDIVFAQKYLLILKYFFLNYVLNMSIVPILFPYYCRPVALYGVRLLLDIIYLFIADKFSLYTMSF